MPDIPWTQIDNRVVDIIENPCGADWWTIVKLAKPAAGDALEMLIVPQPSEILEATIEQKFARGGSRFGKKGGDRGEDDHGHGRRRRRRRGIPQIEGEFISAIQGLEAIKGTKIGPTSWLFHRLFNFVERLTWYWLVYDSIDTFFHSWVSGIFQSTFCSENAFGSFSASMQFALNSASVPPENPDWTINSQQGALQIQDNIASVPVVGRCVATYSTHVFSLEGHTVQATIRIRLQIDGFTVADEQQGVEAKDGETKPVSVEAFAPEANMVLFNFISAIPPDQERGFASAMFI